MKSKTGMDEATLTRLLATKRRRARVALGYLGGVALLLWGHGLWWYWAGAVALLGTGLLADAHAPSNDGPVSWQQYFATGVLALAWPLTLGWMAWTFTQRFRALSAPGPTPAATPLGTPRFTAIRGGLADPPTKESP